MAYLSRRHVLGLGIGALSTPLLAPARAADAGQEAHGISVFGDLKYPADFHHFDYVNVDAPKGGMFSFIPSQRAFNQSFFTFNSLNAYILKGEGAQGMDMTFASLMARANDEPDAMYGLVARSVQISADKTVYRFTLRPEARFHDGSKLTAHDVAFSLTTLKAKGHPLILTQMRDMVKAEAADDATLVVTFAEKRARDVPLFVASLPMFSQAYYATRPFDELTLDIPLGSGPYKVGKFEVNRYIEFERVKDWWGADLPVNRGSYNFDVVRYEFYRDRDVAFEGFTARNYLFREEFTARVWATRYDFPAVKDGRVKLETLPDETPSGGQGWFMNTRREAFKDARIREALIQAFDFEWTNKTIMYGAYARTVSPFQNSDMVAEGLPSPEELKLLEPFRGKVPDEVFGMPFVPPVSDGSGQDRTLLRKASQLLQDAGAVIKDGKRLLPNGDAVQDRVPDRRALVSAASRPLSQEPRHARNRRQPANRRPRAIPGPGGGFRFRRHHPAPSGIGDAGRRHASVLFIAGRGDQGLLQSRRNRRSRHRRIDRESSCRRKPRRSDHRLPRLRSGVSRRALLGAAMVSCHPPDRLLGPVCASAQAAALCAGRRRAGKLVVRSGQGGQGRAGEIIS